MLLFWLIIFTFPCANDFLEVESCLMAPFYNDKAQKYITQYFAVKGGSRYSTVLKLISHSLVFYPTILHSLYQVVHNLPLTKPIHTYCQTTYSKHQKCNSLSSQLCSSLPQRWEPPKLHPKDQTQQTSNSQFLPTPSPLKSPSAAYTKLVPQLMEIKSSSPVLPVP